jgi:hypothetical protein
MASAERGLQRADKSQLTMPKSRFLIALHSPNALLETGLRICPPEKRRNEVPFAAEQSVLSSHVVEQRSRTMGMCVSREQAANFLCSRGGVRPVPYREQIQDSPR